MVSFIVGARGHVSRTAVDLAVSCVRRIITGTAWDALPSNPRPPVRPSITIGDEIGARNVYDTAYAYDS
jgi:hypothetical protein